MQYKLQLAYPPVSRVASDILTLFGPAAAQIQANCRALTSRGPQHVFIGLDLEFDQSERPTVLGVSDGVVSVSVPWRDGLPYFKQLLARWPEMVFVGHSFVSADLFVLRGEGLELKLENVEDTIIRYYLANAHLCKGTGKSEDGDGEKRGKGYMNLWAFVSQYTSASNWKECRGPECDGTYCPEHDVYGYNGLDSLGPVLAFPEVIKQSKLRGVDGLYEMHRELCYVLAEMARYGVQADVPYLAQLKDELLRDKARLAEQLPFSPASPKQVRDYFKAKGITLEDAQEATIREVLEDHDDAELETLLAWKELGKGADAWFGDKFMDARGRVYPRLGIFTSSGRMQCSSPNFQNLPRRRLDRHKCVCEHDVAGHTPMCRECACTAFRGQSIGKKIRRAVIASPGTYLLKGDYSNAENRVVLHLAGHAIPREVDLHPKVAEMAGLSLESPSLAIRNFCIKESSPREAAKTIQHGGNYCETIQLKTPEELRQPRIKKEISVGARVVYPNWRFNGKIVTFTGANLAERAFGDKSWENRAKALEVYGKYFGAFPGVREWQRRLSEDCERQRAVVTPLKYFCLSYGDDADRIKQAAAIHGSQPVAHYTKLALIDIARNRRAGRPMRAILQVHDEIVCEVRDDVAPEVAGRWLQESMEIEVKEIPGLVLPVDPSYGKGSGETSNWRDQTKLKLS